jgi:predicted nucleic acid-binding protein
MTVYYLDTSVAVHALTGTASAVEWFDRVTETEDHTLVSSRILRTELTRVLRRDGEPVRRRDEILDYVDIAGLTEAVLTTAEAIADHIRTLDAIHLATAMALGADTVVVTHDAQLTGVAAGLGYRTFDPIAGFRG